MRSGNATPGARSLKCANAGSPDTGAFTWDHYGRDAPLFCNSHLLSTHRYQLTSASSIAVQLFSSRCPVARDYEYVTATERRRPRAFWGPKVKLAPIRPEPVEMVPCWAGIGQRPSLASGGPHAAKRGPRLIRHCDEFRCVHCRYLNHVAVDTHAAQAPSCATGSKAPIRFRSPPLARTTVVAPRTLRQEELSRPVDRGFSGDLRSGVLVAV
jgi:hypothetical protein